MGKILIISNDRPNSGWGTYNTNLKEALGKNAEFYYLFGPTSGEGTKDFPTVIPNPSTRTELMARVFPKWYFRDLARKIRMERRDGLVVHYSYNLLPIITYGSSDIVTIHDTIFAGKYRERSLVPNMYSKLLLYSFLKFSNIISPSKHIKNELQGMGAEGEIEAIYPPVPNSFFRIQQAQNLRKKLHLPEDKILILSLGNNKPWKNLEMVAKVMDRLGERYQLIRVGPGVGNSITFSGVNATVLNELYNACDLLLFLSLEEGFGYPIVEAMSTGLAPVVSDIEVFHEIGADAVEYVNPLDLDSIVEGVMNALNNRDHLQTLAKERIKHFSMNIFREKLLSYYARF